MIYCRELQILTSTLERLIKKRASFKKVYSDEYTSLDRKLYALEKAEYIESKIEEFSKMRMTLWRKVQGLPSTPHLRHIARDDVGAEDSLFNLRLPAKVLVTLTINGVYTISSLRNIIQIEKLAIYWGIDKTEIQDIKKALGVRTNQMKKVAQKVAKVAA